MEERLTYVRGARMNTITRLNKILSQGWAKQEQAAAVRQIEMAADLLAIALANAWTDDMRAAVNKAQDTALVALFQAKLDMDVGDSDV